MKRFGLLTVLILLLAACGGDDSGDSGDAGGGGESGGASGGGNVVDVQAPGDAHASVDGNAIILMESPSLACNITEDAVTFAFWVGDNSVTLGGGANRYDDGWLGSIDLRIAEPEGEAGPITYYVDVQENGDRIAIDGDSMSYSGPMMKQPPNDGSNPDPVDAGDGTISVTCG